MTRKIRKKPDFRYPQNGSKIDVLTGFDPISCSGRRFWSIWTKFQLQSSTEWPIREENDIFLDFQHRKSSFFSASNVFLRKNSLFSTLATPSLSPPYRAPIGPQHDRPQDPSFFQFFQKLFSQNQFFLKEKRPFFHIHHHSIHFFVTSL